MAKTPTLEEFVENYIKNKEKENSALDYPSWLANNGISSERIYSDTVRDIEADYKRGLSEYGKRGEGLARLGLTASGYSDYINGKAYSEMQRRKSDAKDTYTENEAKNASGYASYLDGLKSTADSAYDGVIKEITQGSVINYDEAYNMAIKAGLSVEDATYAAKVGSDMAKKKLNEDVMNVIISKNLDEDQAELYALNLGLSKADALRLAAFAKDMHYSYYSSSYLDYIRDKLESGK